MHTLMVVAWGLIALGILVFVHELGHFLVAKASGIRVLKFSLGFGTTLVGFKHGETEYAISSLPFGGYVKLAGEQYEEGQPIAPGDYFSRPWWVRVLVLMAGPAMNLIAAMLVVGTLYWVGFMAPIAQPQVAEVTAGGPAAAALKPGDVITSLQGEPVADWEKFADLLQKIGAAQPGQALTLGLLRQGTAQTVSLIPTLDSATKKWRLGIGLSPAATSVIDRVFVGTPAEMAGFKAGDRVLSVDRQPVWTKYDFQNLVWPRAHQAVSVLVDRRGQQVALTVKPIEQMMPDHGKVGVIGVSFKASDKIQRIAFPFLEAYRLGAVKTYTISETILTSVGQMITGQVNLKDAVGGPISIVRMAGQEANSGVQDFLFFLASISVMLGILNLLPIPVLDGGNALLFVVEGIRRRPVPAKWQDGFQRVGLVLLVALMLYATYNDLYKMIAPVLGVKP